MNRRDDGEHVLFDGSELEFFSEEALRGVFEINHSLLEMLVAAAKRPDSESRPQVVVALGTTLLGLGADARQYLARCPVALVDLEFRNVDLWRQIECVQGVSAARPSSLGCFPRLQAIQLAQATLTLAWSLVRSSRETASIILGIAPECAARLAGLGAAAVQRLAETQAPCLRPRWDTDATFWRELLRIAQDTDSPAQPRLPPIGVYALQRQFADLVPLSPRTCNS
jgi:hypothetical protein